MTELNLDGLTDSQKRLFAVRCARRVQHLMQDPRSIDALDVAERYALGQATNEELKEAWAAWEAVIDIAMDVWEAASAEAWAAAWEAASAAAWAAAHAAWAAAGSASDAERAAQAQILEEIRGMK